MHYFTKKTKFCLKYFVHGCSNQCFAPISILKNHSLWLVFFLKVRLHDSDNQLVKIQKRVSMTQEFWKLLVQFVNIRSMHAELKGFSKYVGTFIKSLRLYLVVENPKVNALHLHIWIKISH